MLFMADETDKSADSNDRLQRTCHADSAAETSQLYAGWADENDQQGRYIDHACLSMVPGLEKVLCARVFVYESI
jgi:hypothetical protein